MRGCRGAPHRRPHQGLDRADTISSCDRRSGGAGGASWWWSSSTAVVRLRSLDRRTQARWRPSARGSRPRARGCAPASRARGERATSWRPTARWSTRAEDWIWAADGDGTLTFSNAAGAALLGHDDLVGRAAGRAHPRRRPAPSGWAGVVRRKHADGSLRTVDTRSVRSGARLAGHRPRPERGRAPARESRAGRRVVRWPVVDGRREVVALRADRRRQRARRLHARRAGRARRRAARCGSTLDGDAAAGARPRPRRAPAHARRAPAERARRCGRGLRARARRLRGHDRRCSSTAGSSRSRVAGREDDELRALIAEPGRARARAGRHRRRRRRTSSPAAACSASRTSRASSSPARAASAAGSGALASLQALARADHGGRLVRGARAHHRRRRRPLDRAAAPRQLGLLRAPAQDRHRARGADAARHARRPALGDRRRALVGPRGARPAGRARAAARAHVRAARPRRRARRSATGSSPSGCSRSRTRCWTRRWRRCSPRCRSPRRSPARCCATRARSAACWPRCCATSRATSPRRGRPDRARRGLPRRAAVGRRRRALGAP